MINGRFGSRTSDGVEVRPQVDWGRQVWQRDTLLMAPRGGWAPETTYTVYTYHAWDSGNILSVTTEGDDSNNIINVHQIEAGQQLVIPSPSGTPPGPAAGEQIHTVQPGENLFRIALQYSLSFETVAAYNGIPWPYTIYVGQQIKIPGAP